MGIVNYRVDDRLIHGIVAGYWANSLQATRIMVIDDGASASDLVRTSLRMACPAGLSLSVLTLEKAVVGIKAGNYETQRVFAIAKTPEVFMELQRNGILVDAVYMGNITYTADRLKVAKTVSVNAAETAALEELSSKGTKIINQLVPQDAQQDFMDMLHKAQKK